MHSHRYLDTTHSSDLIRRLQGEAERLQEIVNKSLDRVLTGSVRFLGGLAIVFYLDWRLAIPGCVIHSSLTWNLRCASHFFL